MNYRVLISSDVKKAIAALAPDLRVPVLKKLLSELPSDPNRYLGEVVVPLSLRAYNFQIPDSQGKPYWFVFHLDGIDPASKPDLRVVGMRYTDFDPDTDAAAAP